MSTPSPFAYSNYPREQIQPLYGTAEKLRALGDAYYGLSWVFLSDVALYFLVLMIASQTKSFSLFLGLLLAGRIFVGLFAFRSTKRLALGLSWGTVGAVISALILAIGVGGIITYVVLQMIAAMEIKKYGVLSSLFGFRKKVYKAVLAERESQVEPNPAFQTF